MEFVRLLTSFSGNFMANFSWVDCEYRGGDGGSGRGWDFRVQRRWWSSGMGGGNGKRKHWSEVTDGLMQMNMGMQ